MSDISYLIENRKKWTDRIFDKNENLLSRGLQLPTNNRFYKNRRRVNFADRFSEWN